MNLLAEMTACLLMVVPGVTSTVAPPEAEHDLTGNWVWEWTDADGAIHRHVMVVKGMSDQYAAQERRDDLDPVEVTQLKLDGDQISFSVVRGESRATYTGKFADADTINGQVQVTQLNNLVEEFGWTAQRRAVEDDEPTEIEPPVEDQVVP